MKKVLLFIFLVLCVSVESRATTYYVDYVGGANTNNGTTTVTPWKVAPGMPGCNSNCGSATMNPGDSIILKGGVSWPMDTIGCWTISYSGSAGNLIYIGVDFTYFTGGAWTRPILNGHFTTTQISGSCPGVGSWNNFLATTGNYLLIDNIEATGMNFNPGGTAFTVSSGHDVTFQHNYCHFWTISNPANGAGSDEGACFYSNSQSGLVPSVNLRLLYNIADGIETATVQADPNCTSTDKTIACLATGSAVGGFWDEAGWNVWRYMHAGFDGVMFGPLHDNLITNIRFSTNSPTNNPGNFTHPNGIQFDKSCFSFVYNNVIQHTYSPPYPAGGFTTLGPSINSGCTEYVFNNVITDTGAANSFNLFYASSDHTPGGSVHGFNNTVECGPDIGPNGVCLQGGPCIVESYMVCDAANNHYVTSVTAVVGCTSPCTSVNSPTQSLPAANLQGYSAAQPYVFSPINISGITVTTAGTNETALCNAMGGAPAAACQCDTTYAVTYNLVDHTATPNAKACVPRPTSGSWNVGAYQFGTPQSGTPPAPLLSKVTEAKKETANEKGNSESVFGRYRFCGIALSDSCSDSSSWAEYAAQRNVYGDR